jgi:hypothetical protein
VVTRTPLSVTLQYILSVLLLIYQTTRYQERKDHNANALLLSYKLSKYYAVTHKHGRSPRSEIERCREETSKIRVKSAVLYRRTGSRKLLEDFQHPRLLLGDTGCCVHWCQVGTICFYVHRIDDLLKYARLMREKDQQDAQ